MRESPIHVNEKGEGIVAKEVPMEAGSKNDEGKDADRLMSSTDL